MTFWWSRKDTLHKSGRKVGMLIVVVVGFLIVIHHGTGLNLLSANRDKVVETSIDSKGDIANMEKSLLSMKTEAAIIDGCSLAGDENVAEKRVIAIGDIHGSYGGLLEDLFAANITSSLQLCQWRKQETATLLVQMGDMVDRGAGALESLECLRHLQSTATGNNAQVVRLLGNHELWWLTGMFHQRNKADTEEKIIKFLRLLWDDILTRKIVGSYVHYFNKTPVVFVHAGYTDAFVDYLKLDSAESISNYTNNHLVYSVSQCSRLPCQFITKHELYKAGPSRGGSGIGGPYWTDFTTLFEEDSTRKRLSDISSKNFVVKPFVQVVGHTMAFCYDPRAPGKHPPDHVAECSLGLIRASSGLQSICIDAGMYAGARGFLEITRQGRYIAYERRGDINTTPWKRKDLTREYCEK